MPSRRFSNKVTLVTGASRGIGLATVEQFAREGGLVVASGIDREEFESAVAKQARSPAFDQSTRRT